ncbi:unnamed protein product [Closterium sp. NIES-53]
MTGTFGVSQVCAAEFQELKEEFILKNQSLGFKIQVISKLSKRFRDPSWLGTVWHCSTSLYLGSWEIRLCTLSFVLGTFKPPQVAASAQVSASGQVSASPPALACPALPLLRQGAAARRSSVLLVSRDDYSLQTLHMDVWGAACVSGQGREGYFLLVVDDYTRSSSCAGRSSVFLGLPPDAPSWQFYHPTSRRVFPFQEVTFDESVPFYGLFTYSYAPPPPLPPFLAPGPPPVDPLAPQAVGSGAAQGAASGGAGPRGAEFEGPEGVEAGGAESEGAESGGAEPQGTASSRGLKGSSPRLSTGLSLSAPPSDESVESSGPYPQLVGCLMYLMTCTPPDLVYPLSLLDRHVAPERHRKVHWDVAKRVLRYLCSTSGMGLVLGGRGPVVLTETQTLLGSSCEAEIYAGAMAAQELRWLTYVLTDLGEQPRSPLQRGQLRLAYVATRASTADIFTKALPPSDHQRFSTILDLLALFFLTSLVTTCSPPLGLWGVTDLISHLRSLDATFHAAFTADDLGEHAPPSLMYLTLHLIAARLPNRLAHACGSLLAMHPISLTIDLFEISLTKIGTRLRTVASTFGAIVPPIFEGPHVARVPSHVAATLAKRIVTPPLLCPAAALTPLLSPAVAEIALAAAAAAAAAPTAAAAAVPSLSAPAPPAPTGVDIAYRSRNVQCAV